MVTKRERAEFWPDDLTLLIAHRAQASGIFRLLKENLWQEPSTDRLRHMGNYMLLSSFITSESKVWQSKPSRVEQEKLNYINGMIVAGFKVPAAVENAEKIYSTKLRKIIYPLIHIPEGSPELIETRKNGTVVGTALDIAVLCEQAHILARPTEKN